MATKRTASKPNRAVNVKVNGVDIVLDYSKHTPFSKLADITSKLANSKAAPYTDGLFLEDFREVMHMYLDDKTYASVFTDDVEDDIYANLDIYIDVYGALKTARDEESQAFGKRFASLFNADMD